MSLSKSTGERGCWPPTSPPLSHFDSGSLFSPFLLLQGRGCRDLGKFALESRSGGGGVEMGQPLPLPSETPPPRPSLLQACVWPRPSGSECSENSTCTFACRSLFAALSSWS